MKRTSSNNATDWYKDAIFYEAYVRGFHDSSSDGNGDLRGLIEKLDYLRDLGVDCLWLMPIYASPLKDDGYDIADFRKIHPTIGTVEDFEALTAAAHERGIRIIADLVINHTSDQHPWFQEARRDPTLAVARLLRLERHRPEIPGRAHHLHRHRALQLDLGPGRPPVLLAPLLQPSAGPELRQPRRSGGDARRHGVLARPRDRRLPRRRRALPLRARGDQLREPPGDAPVPQGDAAVRRRALPREPCCWPRPTSGRATSLPYFGDGDEFHMAFNFPLMPRMFMAIRREDRRPIIEIMAQMPPIPPSCQWAIFLRNHDELTLEMVTDEERDYMYARVRQGPADADQPGHPPPPGPAHGQRPAADGAPAQPALHAAGQPRSSTTATRSGWATTSTWATATASGRPCSGRGDRNAGFSRADPSRLYPAGHPRPVYHYQAVNVEAQMRSPTSLLNWLRRLIRVRKSHGLRPRLARVRPLREPPGRRLPPLIRRPDGPGRQQPLPIRPAGRARPEGL